MTGLRRRFLRFGFRSGSLASSATCAALVSDVSVDSGCAQDTEMLRTTVATIASRGSYMSDLDIMLPIKSSAGTLERVGLDVKT